MMYGWIIIVVLVLVAIWYFGRAGFNRSNKSEESPLEILKKCFANGEITKEEYEERKRFLEKEN